MSCHIASAHIQATAQDDTPHPAVHVACKSPLEQLVHPVLGKHTSSSSELCLLPSDR